MEGTQRWTMSAQGDGPLAGGCFPRTAASVLCNGRHGMGRDDFARPQSSGCESPAAIARVGARSFWETFSSRPPDLGGVWGPEVGPIVANHVVFRMPSIRQRYRLPR